MANSYTNSVTTIDLNPADLEIIDYVIEQGKDHVFNSIVDGERLESCDFLCEVEGKKLVISDGGSGSFNTEHAALFIQFIVNALQVETPVICQYAFTSDKANADSFGGGAFLVRKDQPVTFCDPFTILSHTANLEITDGIECVSYFVDVYDKLKPSKLRKLADSYEVQAGRASLTASGGKYGKAELLRNLADLIEESKNEDRINAWLESIKQELDSGE